MTASTASYKNRRLITSLGQKDLGFDNPWLEYHEHQAMQFAFETQAPQIQDSPRLFERFRDFLPFAKMDTRLSLGEGNTPLVNANKNVSEFSGVEVLFCKNEFQNPTGSFKDRGSLVTMFLMDELGYKKTATVSSGNMGQSTAAYCAHCNFDAFIFVPEFAPPEKINAIANHGATVIVVQTDSYAGLKEEVIQNCLAAGMPISSGNGPIRVEGYKLTAFELAEQFEFQMPDYIIIPTSAAGHVRGLYFGFVDLYKQNLIAKVPTMVMAQAANVSPIASAYLAGQNKLTVRPQADTVAKALINTNPPGVDDILKLGHERGWLAAALTESEIMEAHAVLAENGLFIEPSSATSLAALRQLTTAGKIQKQDQVVLMLTGSGFKDQGSIQRKSQFITETKLSDVRDLIHDNA